MKYHLSCVPAVNPDGMPASDPAELCPPPRKQIPAADGLIFHGRFSAFDIHQPSASPEFGDMCRTARVWGWCEWLRISLVAAALIAAALVVAARTMAEGAQAQGVRLQSPPLSQAATLPQPLTEAGSAGPETVGTIHYWSDDSSTTVTIDLQKLVFFEAHRLTGPDRVYFDLQSTQMPLDLQRRLIQVDVAETFVRKIRMAERGPGVTRVVLETTPNADYSAMIAPDPYRLVIKLHARQ